MASNAPQDLGQPLILEDFTQVEPPVTISSAALCAVCHAILKQTKRCAGCKDITYCSKNCQMNDWAEHKLICKSFAQSPRPTATYRRALYFAAPASRPSIVWLHYGDDGKPLDIAKCFPDTPKEDLKTIGFHDRYLPYWIQLSYDGNTNGDRHLAEDSLIRHALRGPVLALAYDAEEGLSKPALNVDTRSLRAILSYLKLRVEYPGPIFVEQPQVRYTEEELAVLLKGKKIL